MSDPEPNKKGFNRIFVIIPVIVVAFIIIFAVTSINTDIKEHEAFREIQILNRDLYLDGFDIRADLVLYNPNMQYDAKLDRIDLFVYAGNNNIAEVTVPQYITIPKNTKVSVPVDVTIRKTGLLTTAIDYIRNNDVGKTVQGTVYYDSIFGTHETTFNMDLDTQRNTAQSSVSQQCNNAVNNYLAVLEPILESSYSISEFEQAMHRSGYDFDYMVFEIDEICGNYGEDGLINNPNLDTYTKNRLYGVFSKMEQLLN